MRNVRQCLVVIAGSLLVGTGAWAQESPEPRPALVVVPSFQGELPDGTPVWAIVVVPAENVLKRNAAWQAWEAAWPTTYRLAPTAEQAP